MPVKTLTVGAREIGPGHPVFVIAEGGVNHNGSVDRAKKIIDAAAEAGADAIKFQRRNLAEVYQQKVLADPNKYEQKYQYLIPLLQEFELPAEAFIALEEYAKKKGIMFLVNPWDPSSLAEVEAQLHIPLYKVGSPDMTNDELLELLAATKKPMILSTGMSKQDEVDHAVALLRSLDVSFALLHANNTYPAPFDEVNLHYMDHLKKHDVPVGYSGHERGVAVTQAAVARGAVIVERHLTTDKSLDGPDHKASLDPAEFKVLVTGIREITQALGDGEKKMSRAEILNREILGKSVVAATTIPEGTEITREMLTTKSPAKGVSPQRMNDVIGITAPRDIFPGDPITEDDLSADSILETFTGKGISWKWGPVVRVNEDFQRYLHYQPKVFEFHLSDKDLDETLPTGSFSQELVVHAPEYMHRTYLDPSSADADVLAVSRSTLHRAVELTKRLGESFTGTPKLVIHPGGITLEPDTDPQRLRDRFAATLQELAAKADSIELLPENLPPRPWVFGGEWVGNIFLLGEEIESFLREHSYRMCFDTSHAALACNAAGADLAKMVDRLKTYIAHLHVADGAGIGDEGLQIGEGTVNWADVLKPLQNYQNTMVPEIWQGHLRGGRGFLQAMEHLRPYLQ